MGMAACAEATMLRGQAGSTIDVKDRAADHATGAVPGQTAGAASAAAEPAMGPGHPVEPVDGYLAGMFEAASLAEELPMETAADILWSR